MGEIRGRAVGLLGAMVLALTAAGPASAATDPHDTVGGAGSKWASGDLIQQIGLNCSIIGNNYTEVMVSGVADYGGAPGGGAPKVGQRYYTSLLLSIPGNPCGSGSSSVATDVILPRGTTVDTSAPIRCFGQPRNTNNVIELTGGNWSAFGQSGPYCPTSVSPSPRHAGAVSVGFRPLASGQLFWVFVPVKSTQVLSGTGTNDRFVWTTDATGVYENPGASSVYSWVFDSTASTTPFVYFTRQPNPFWKGTAPSAPDDLRNRAEFWVNVYTAGQAGYLCFEIRDVATNAFVGDCSQAGDYDGTVPAGFEYVQILPAPGESTGPEGGYVPFAYTPPGEWGRDLRITWTFNPTPAGPDVTGSQTFRTLPGPDGDGDGVADSADTCPGTVGTQADGCMPPARADDDKDGVFGDEDKCPSADGGGTLDGCPTAAAPAGPGPTTPGGPTPGGGPLAQLTPIAGKIAAPAGGKLGRKALLSRRGAPVKISCTGAASATLTLTVTGKEAKRLRLGSKPVTLATAKGSCVPGAELTLRLKPKGKAATRLKRTKSRVGATLRLALKGADGKTASAAKSIAVTK